MSKALDWLKNKSWPIAIVVLLLALVSGSVGQYVQDEPADVVNVGNTTLTGNTTLVVPEAFWSPPKDVPAATAFVISSDVPVRVRAAALGMKQVYGALIQICNGANDHVEIQAAVTAAAGGDTCLSFGDYDIQGGIVMPTDSTIYGAGADTKLIIPDLLNGTFDVISSTGTSRVVVRDLMIDGGTQTAGTQNAIYFTNVSQGEIFNCFIYSFTHWMDDGIRLSGSTGCIIRNNVFNLVCLTAITLNASSDNNLITGNYVTACGDGVDLYASSNNIVQGNHFNNNDYVADIFIDGTSHRNLIDTNNFYSPVDCGIDLDGGDYNVISNNAFTDTGKQSILVYTGSHYTTISDNRIDECGDYGITVYESDYCIVQGNHIENTDYDGIWLHNAHHSNVSNNFVIAAAQGFGGYYDIFIETSDYCLIEGNTARAGSLAFQPDHGINIDGGTGDIVRDNDLYDDGFAVSPFVNTGIDTAMHEIFIPYPDPDGNIGTHPALVLTDAADVTGRFEVPIPMNFHQVDQAEVIIVPAGTGNMRRSVDTNWGKVGTTENYNAGTDAIAAGQVAVTISDLELIDILAALTGIAAGDSIGVEFTRVGTHVDDTVNADCYLVGFRMLYV